MSELLHNKNREAWASIRGYVYQLYYTVLLWVRLQEGSELQCECGEDIDEVQRQIDESLAQPDKISGRILNQVKYRERSLTLKSTDLLDCLSSYLETRTANPEIDLKLCYLTNASPGKEQGSKFPDGMGGIEALSALPRLSESQKDEVLSQFRTIVTSKVNWHPKTSPAGNRYCLFQEFANSSTRESLLAFLLSIQWDTGSYDFDTIRRQIPDELMAQGFAVAEHAGRAFNDLFASVASILSRRGPKKLTWDLRMKILEGSGVDSKAKEYIGVLLALQDQILEFDPLIRETHTMVSGLGPELVKIQDQLKSIQHSALAAGPAPQPDEPPLVFPKSLDRSSLIEDLESKSSSWIHLQGGAGRGKSRLLAQMSATRDHIWIDFSNIEAQSDPGNYLERKLVASLCALLKEQSWWVMYRAEQVKPWAILARLLRKKEIVLLIDDIPDLNVSKSLSRRLTELAFRIDKETSSRLITSSEASLPSIVKSELANIVTEETIRNLDRSDLNRLVELYECPSSKREQCVTLLLSATQGHVTLAIALIGHLERSKWDLDSSSPILSVLDAAQKDAARRLLTIHDNDVVELCYRVASLRRDFSMEEVDTVASIPPPIRTPRQHFTQLLGGWIETKKSGRFAVSPLITSSPQSLVETTLYKKIHQTMGRKLASYNNDFSRMLEAVSHLHSGGLHGDCCDLMFPKLFQRLTEFSDVTAALPIAFLYPPGRVPKFLSELQVLQLRFVQIFILNILYQPNQELEADFDRLFFRNSRQKDYKIVQLAAGYYLGVTAPGIPASKIKRLAKAISIHREGQVQGFAPEDGHFLDVAEDLLLAPITEAQTLDETLEAVKAFFDLPRQLVEKLISSDFGIEMGRAIADSCWCTGPSERTAEEWQSVITALEFLRTLARNHNFESLEVSALRSIAFVLADQLQQVEEALEFLQENEPPDLSDAGRGQLIYARACVLNEHGHDEMAVAVFEEVIAFPESWVRFFEHMKLDSYCRLHISLRRLGRHNRALEIGLQGLKWGVDRETLAWLKPGVSARVYLELVAEVAMCYWELGDRKKAVASLYGVVELMYREEEQELTRRGGLERKLSNTLLWMRAQSSLGFAKGVNVAASFTTPNPGLFYKQFQALEELATPIEPMVRLALAETCIAYDLLPLSDSSLERSVYQASAERLEWLTLYLKASWSITKALQGDMMNAILLGAESAVHHTPNFLRRNPDFQRQSKESVHAAWNALPLDDRAYCEDRHLRDIYVACFLGLWDQNFENRQHPPDKPIPLVYTQGAENALEILSWAIIPPPFFKAISSRAAELRKLTETNALLCDLVIPTISDIAPRLGAKCHGELFFRMLPGEQVSELVIRPLARYILSFWNQQISRILHSSPCPTFLKELVEKCAHCSQDDEVEAACKMLLSLQFPLAFSYKEQVLTALQERSNMNN